MDIVERLKDYSRADTDALMDEAAVEIARLRDENESLRGSLEEWKLDLNSLRDENARLRVGLTEICTFPRHRMPGEIARETLAAMQKGE